MKRQPLDLYDDMPADMKNYLKNYGWHFNKKACDFAVALMRKKDPNVGKLVRIQPWSKEDVETMLRNNNITLDNATGYDAVFVANMCKADFFKGSVPDEPHLALYVKETIDDPDAADGVIMRRWFATMVANGEVIFWEDFL